MSQDPRVDELLMAHAAGRLPEPVSLVVATHLALSPASRERYRRYEAVGGALLEELEPIALGDDAWVRLLARLGETPRDAPRPARCSTPGLPGPLCHYLPAPIEQLPWRSYGHAAEVELTVKAPGYRTTLVRVRAGSRVPRHTHEGSELTLVLAGGFRDETGHYRLGDLAVADSSIDHRPIADVGANCLCLTVTDAPLRLTGLFGRVLNPFVNV